MCLHASVWSQQMQKKKEKLLLFSQQILCLLLSVDCCVDFSLRPRFCVCEVQPSADHWSSTAADPHTHTLRRRHEAAASGVAERLPRVDFPRTWMQDARRRESLLSSSSWTSHSCAARGGPRERPAAAQREPACDAFVAGLNRLNPETAHNHIQI